MLILLGAGGYVGTAYRAYLQARGIPFQGISRADVDYGNVQHLTKLLRETQATFLVNAAGYTGKPNVDACEEHKAECLLGNAVLPGVIAEACANANLPWGHISSGCIFSGRRAAGMGFRETDTPNFSFRTNHCSFYSGTKALGEEILQGAPPCYIWRLRIPFNESDGPRNYLTKVMRYERLLEAENSLSQLDEFVRATYACWEKRVPFGIYNTTNPGFVTTHEVVDLIKKHGTVKKDFKFFKNEDEFMRLAAKTPRSNCVLDSSKLQAAGIQMTEVHEAIDQALRHWRTA